MVCKQWNQILKQDDFVKMTIRGILNELYDFSNLVEGKNDVFDLLTIGGGFMDQLNDQCDDSSPVDQIFSEQLAKYFTNTEFK